jgi:Fe-S cluster biogenesis protein NfuA
MRDKVEAVLNDIRPSLQADGGDLQLVDVNDGVVTVNCSSMLTYMSMSKAIIRKN